MNKKIPVSIETRILSDIKNRINPNLKIIFLKLFVVHLFTAIVTLSFCPQLGFQTFPSSINLMHVFMNLGQDFCNLACGTFFTATSIAVALFMISRDELRVLRHHRVTAVLSIVLSSIGFFVIMNPPLFFELSLLWISGAIIGAGLTLEVGTKLQLVRGV